MSRIGPWVGVLGLAGLGVILALAWQSGQIRRLEDRLRAFEAVSVPGPAPTAAVPRPSAPATLDEGEKLELLRLRGEITRLRERQGELARQDEENAALRGRITGGSSNPASAGLPSGFVPRAQVPLAGYGTPHAAFQSLLWAVEHRDTNVFFRALTGGSRQQMMAMAERGGADAFWREVGMIPGYHYVGEKSVDDETAALTIEFLPGEPTEIIARREAGDWRLEMR